MIYYFTAHYYAYIKKLACNKLSQHLFTLQYLFTFTFNLCQCKSIYKNTGPFPHPWKLFRGMDHKILWYLSWIANVWTTRPEVLLMYTSINQNLDPSLKMMSRSNATATRKGTKPLGDAVLIPSWVLKSFFHNTCPTLEIAA